MAEPAAPPVDPDAPSYEVLYRWVEDVLIEAGVLPNEGTDDAADPC